MRRERPVEPVPLRAAGESEPYSRKSPALSPGEETAGAARATRDACRTGAPSGHGGECRFPKRLNKYFYNVQHATRMYCVDC